MCDVNRNISSKVSKFTFSSRIFFSFSFRARLFFFLQNNPLPTPQNTKLSVPYWNIRTPHPTPHTPASSHITAKVTNLKVADLSDVLRFTAPLTIFFIDVVTLRLKSLKSWVIKKFFMLNSACETNVWRMWDECRTQVLYRRRIDTFITKTRLFKYTNKKKNENFQIKILIFFISLLKT